MKKFKYNINNLDCANCAREIEESLNKRNDMQNVTVNFNTSRLIFESNKDFKLKELNELVKKIEPGCYITENNINPKKEYHLSILIVGILLSLVANFINNNIIKTLLFITAYTLLLYKIFINAIKLLIRNKTINEYALITISCIGAFILGEVMEGMMVISLYLIGKILEEKAINKSRNSIKGLLDIKEPFANIKINNTTKKINVEEVKVDDILVIKKGEKIPVDGIIIKGNTKLDTSSLTGESYLIEKKPNDIILSGSINMENLIEIKATKTFNDSTVSKILDLLESATDKKTKTETSISKISKIYTPVVLLLSILVIIFLPLLFKIPLKTSIYRALTFLVISCPCAIAISVPLSYFTGIGASSKKGILIKGSNYLDNLSNIENIVFDKTGTLTDGTFNIKKIEVIDNDYNEQEIKNILLKGESLSNHPIANSILNNTNEKIENKDILDFKELTGKGITFTLDNKKISIGNKKLCKCNIDTSLHMNINDKHVASIIIDDGIKDKAKETIEKLKNMKIKTYMFTGDKKDIALNIGKILKIDEIKYEMLPTDKFNEYELISKNGITAFVGDGINDAPVLKRSDIGISMGSIGTDSAIEASDVVLMSDELERIPEAINISKYTKHIIKQNLIFAFAIKIIILLLSIFGLANMWMAVFADTGVTLLTILNTLRIGKK